MEFKYKNGSEICKKIEAQKAMDFDKLYNEFCKWINKFWEINNIEEELTKSGYCIIDTPAKYGNFDALTSKCVDMDKHTYAVESSISEDIGDFFVFPYALCEAINLPENFKNRELWKRFSKEENFKFDILLRGNRCFFNSIKLKKCTYSLRIKPIK